jgi:hypothetical protein
MEARSQIHVQQLHPRYAMNSNKPHVNKIHVYAKQLLAYLKRITNNCTMHMILMVSKDYMFWWLYVPSLGSSSVIPNLYRRRTHWWWYIELSKHVWVFIYNWLLNTWCICWLYAVNTVCSVSLCCSVYCLCVNVYWNTATGISGHYSTTLTEVFPCFLLSCKANARV